MSGSRLGRGRSGRLAVYGGCGVVVLLLVFLYRAATSEMARLRELHVQCAHQQEALAAQLQVIFEYKVRLEKSLAEEKSSNAAVKQELQQRASREKSLRDKDSIEAMQRINSLQQMHKMLQTEHQDLEEKCKRQEQQALEEKSKLKSRLEELRGQVMQAEDDKRKALEHLKNKYLELQTNNTRLENMYSDLRKKTANTDSTIEHCEKITAQLETELKSVKDACKGDPLSNPMDPQAARDSVKPFDPPKDKKKAEEDQEQQQQQQQQQVSSPNDGEANPRPIDAPRVHQTLESPASNEKQSLDETLPNEEPSNIRFAQQNGNIVPTGSNDLANDNRDSGDANEPRKSLPLPYDFQERHRADQNEIHPQIPKNPRKIPETGDDDRHKQVIQQPPGRNDEERGIAKKSSSRSPKDDFPIPKPQNADSIPRPDEQDDQLDPVAPVDSHIENDELGELQGKVDGILDQ